MRYLVLWLLLLVLVASTPHHRLARAGEQDDQEHHRVGKVEEREVYDDDDEDDERNDHHHHDHHGIDNNNNNNNNDNNNHPALEQQQQQQQLQQQQQQQHKDKDELFQESWDETAAPLEADSVREEEEDDDEEEEEKKTKESHKYREHKDSSMATRDDDHPDKSAEYTLDWNQENDPMVNERRMDPKQHEHVDNDHHDEDDDDHHDDEDDRGEHLDHHHDPTKDRNEKKKKNGVVHGNHHDEATNVAEHDSEEGEKEDDEKEDDEKDDESEEVVDDDDDHDGSDESNEHDSHTTPTTGTTTDTTMDQEESHTQAQEQPPKTYGVDLSWPMQSIQRLLRAESSGTSPFQGRYRAYHSHLQGCAAYYHNAEACKRNEDERMRWNQHQPRHMRNFTTLGYAKVMAPTKTFAILQAFWRRDHRDDTTSTSTSTTTATTTTTVAPDANPPNKKRPRRRAHREEWSEGNIHVNHWSHPTEIYPVDHDAPPYGLTLYERQVVLEEVRDVLQRWISKGMAVETATPMPLSNSLLTTPLVPTSLYGIRVYPHGSILVPHVDRLPLVLSAVINVAQGGMQEDWPLEVIGHDGVAVNLTLQPGEMILYEGHSVIHGRPFPLNGSYYANLFVHFEPVGYTEEMERKMMQRRRHEQQQKHVEEASSGHYAHDDVTVHDQRRHSAKELFERAFAKQLELQQEMKEKRLRPEDNSKTWHNRLPSYIQQGSQEAKRWLQDFVFFRKETPKKASSSGGGSGSSVSQGARKFKHVTTAHIVAANGDLEQLKQVEKENPESLFKADDNGWKPLHEAARAGKTDIVEYLLKRGKEKNAKVDINERTNQGKGANALWWAKQQLPDAHPVIKLLEQHGAVAVAPNE